MKFPRTPHLPGSRGTDDDIHVQYSYAGEVVATEKMDGSNIMMNSDKFITRSGKTSRADWTYPMWNIFYQVKDSIPAGYWLAGEFLHWQKTVRYENLPHAFIVFGVMKGNKCLAWDDVVDMASNCGLPTVRVIARGNPQQVISAAKNEWREGQEGFVVRPVAAFSLPHYQENVAKWVNGDHVATATNNGINHIVS